VRGKIACAVLIQAKGTETHRGRHSALLVEFKSGPVRKM